jgi:hypothetical protein
VNATSWDSGRWLIQSGLIPGDQVIVDGTGKVGPGRPVHPSPYDPKTDSTLETPGDKAATVQVTR